MNFTYDDMLKIEAFDSVKVIYVFLNLYRISKISLETNLSYSVKTNFRILHQSIIMLCLLTIRTMQAPPIT